jgi:hypothetical protein
VKTRNVVRNAMELRAVFQRGLTVKDTAMGKRQERRSKTLMAKSALDKASYRSCGLPGYHAASRWSTELHSHALQQTECHCVLGDCSPRFFVNTRLPTLSKTRDSQTYAPSRGSHYRQFLLNSSHPACARLHAYSAVPGSKDAAAQLYIARSCYLARLICRPRNPQRRCQEGRLWLARRITPLAQTNAISSCRFSATSKNTCTSAA